MRKVFCIVIVASMCGCCGIPVAMKDAIKGNQKIIIEDCRVWNTITKHNEPWPVLFVVHKETCTKCETVEDMKIHLRLRAQANVVRAKKMVELANK